MYPSIMRALNICKNTVRMRYTIIQGFGNQTDIRMSGEDFFKALQTLDTSIFDLGTKLYHLPDFNTMLKELYKTREKEVV